MKKSTKFLAPALAAGMVFGAGSASANSHTVTVDSGDTLWGIAQNHEGVSVEDLKNWNPGVDARSLSIGSELVVSSSSAPDDYEGDRANEEFHTVQPGETLISIANLHEGVTLDDLYNWNPGIDPYSLQLGSEVRVIPADDSTDGSNDTSEEVFHSVQQGETLTSIANLHKNVTLDELYDWNPGIDPRSLQIGSEVRVSPGNGDSDSSVEKYHTVQPGETLISIANLHEGLTLEELYDLNPGIDPYTLQIGSEVKVQ
ncbi:muramidase family protein [Rossellomorea vietnamensis]|uniref:muramidase family protein n=1 Tax=Rossellomorea vietnamensis TaxID=218284 RepID=UPI00165345A1|nr:LysM peptidoglycan-binding domain-containing protein [Rossellomorea vietnamensis]